MHSWSDALAEELHAVRSHEYDESFYGILCAHSLVMLDAFQPEEGDAYMIEVGMRLAQVQNNWVSLLCPQGTGNSGRELRQHIARLVCQFARLLLALVTEDRRCTAKQLTESKELESLAALHSHMGRLSGTTLQLFREYVDCLCALYAMQYLGPSAAHGVEQIGTSFAFSSRPKNWGGGLTR